MHRDLETSQIIFSNDFEVKICDFGLATEIKPEQQMSMIQRITRLQGENEVEDIDGDGDDDDDDFNFDHLEAKSESEDSD